MNKDIINPNNPMKKVYYLSTCSTCKRIMDDLNLSNFEQQDIKTTAITADQLEQMKEMSGSYESLFSRKAMKFRSMGLNEMTLEEKDYRNYILDEYTFLKRPVFIIDDQIFVGNSKKVVEELKALLN
ncbi:ArsC/Spx/MgsR family protein [uncultured Roseivirga sp.]|uniref:arsenate reductase family protein n=1 Tax=uncultured Roseivirga sp. TaxID=543088 RepID=UPI0030DDA438|tara:strand:+ start:176220 stop:176600 length:381 start_codon:yes stop_codon:yes gene_type:complete